MKTVLISAATLIVGLGLGTFYGWRTGMEDGIIWAHLPITALVERYSTCRQAGDVQSRDRAIDTLAQGLAGSFANSRSCSPAFYFIRPKEDAGLMDIASTWELNQSLPSLFEDGKTHPLFSENSPEANRLNEVKQRFKSGYDRTLAEKKAKREKAKPQTPPSSN